MRDAVAFGLLFTILLLRPEGLFGKALERRA
jgi:branched-chain amino acid transport system permease protein